MPIDILNLNTSVKFPYPLSKEIDTEEWVTVRKITAEKLEEINDKTSKLRIEFVQPRKANGKIDKRANLQRIEYQEVTDPTLRNQLFWGELIDEIHIFDNEGVVIPSTLEMKINLMSNCADFANYIADCVEILSGEEEKFNLDKEKN